MMFRIFSIILILGYSELAFGSVTALAVGALEILMDEAVIGAICGAIPALAFVAIWARKARFFFKVAQQVVQLLEEDPATNVSIHHVVKRDPKKNELAKLLAGKVKKIKGLRNLV